MLSTNYKKGSYFVFKSSVTGWNETFSCEIIFTGSLIESESINISLTNKFMLMILQGTQVNNGNVQNNSVQCSKDYVCLM